MRAALLLLAFASVVPVACAPAAAPAAPADPRPAIAALLDDFHDAAAHADEPRYFDHFAASGVFLGTDATERWDVPAFRLYAHPHFERGKAWSFRSVRRNVTVSPAGDVAWFDEVLATANLGPARGSGVVLRTVDGGWRLAQYNLSITVPNERFAEVKRLLEGERPPAEPARPR